MTATFAETSFYVALLTPRDAHHRDAVAFHRTYRGRYVTTEYVLIETATFFTKVGGRPAFVDLVHDLQTDRRVTIIPSSSDLFAKGLALFIARPDKEWSLTDCTSFAVMTDRGLTDALTADHHFAQAGFVRLLA